MATVDMNEIYPDNSNHQVKDENTEPEIITIDEKDIIIEDNNVKEDKKLLKLVKKSPRVYNAVKYGVDQIIIPAALSTLHRFLYSLVDFIIYEGPRGSRGKNEPYDYNGRYRDDDPFETSVNDDTYIYERPYGASRNEQFGLHKIGFATKESALTCLHKLQDKIDDDGRVSVQYFYQYIGRQPPTRMCWQWGWVDLREATVVPATKGFRIKFPEVVNLRDRG